jgi:hypothetical protein
MRIDLIETRELDGRVTQVGTRDVNFSMKRLDQGTPYHFEDSAWYSSIRHFLTRSSVYYHRKRLHPDLDAKLHAMSTGPRVGAKRRRLMQEFRQALNVRRREEMAQQAAKQKLQTKL